MNYLLIGRPNVGKSSIYNILTGSNSNIIHKDSGTTRDWHKAKIFLSTDNYIYDTPGTILDSNKRNNIKSTNILDKLLSEIDYFIFVIDYKPVLNPFDKEAIKSLRRYNKKMLLIINKVDNLNNEISYDKYKYGINNIFLISCAHRLGFDVLSEFLTSTTPIDNISKNLLRKKIDYSLAIFGKPNVGKSTFLNTLLGYERSFTSSVAGTTSDYVTDIFNYKSNIIKIFDTAGIGSKAKINNKSIDFYSINKTFEKIKEVDTAFILIDALKGLAKQDKKIINLISNHAKSLIIIFNKQDLVKNIPSYKKEMLLEIKSSLYQIQNIKVFFCTAFSKKQICKILDYVLINIFTKNNEISTNNINKWLKVVTKQKNIL